MTDGVNTVVRKRLRSALAGNRSRSTIAVDRRPMSARTSYRSGTGRPLSGSSVVYQETGRGSPGRGDPSFMPLLTGTSLSRPSSAASSTRGQARQARRARPQTAPTTRKEDASSSVTKPLTSLRAMLLWKRSNKQLSTYRQRLVNLFEQQEAAAAIETNGIIEDPVAFTTDNVTLHRHLQEDTKIRTAAEAFWRVLYKEQDGLVPLEEYQGYLQRVGRALLPELDPVQAAAVCEEEAIHDAAGRPGLDYRRFSTVLHELTGLWCRSVDVDEYIGFLTDLYNAICIPLPRIGFFPLDKIDPLDEDGTTAPDGNLSDFDEDAPIDTRSDFVPRMKGMVVTKPSSELDQVSEEGQEGGVEGAPSAAATQPVQSSGGAAGQPRAMEPRGAATVEMALQVYDDVLEEKNSHGRRGFLNVASSANGGKVIEASSIFDERFLPANILNDVNADGPGLSWASNGEGVGAFITVQFKQAFTIDSMGFMQRHAAMSHIRRVRLEFPTAEAQVIELDDATGLIQYTLNPAVRSQRVRIVVEEMYYEGGVRNAGACAVEFWAKVNPSMVPFLQDNVPATGRGRSARGGGSAKRGGTRKAKRAPVPRATPVQRRDSRSSTGKPSLYGSFQRRAKSIKEVKWNIEYDNHVLESVIMSRWQRAQEEEDDYYEPHNHSHDHGPMSGSGTHRCLADMVDQGRIPAAVIEKVLPAQTSVRDFQLSARGTPRPGSVPSTMQGRASADMQATTPRRPLTARDYSLRPFGEAVDEYEDGEDDVSIMDDQSSRYGTPVPGPSRDPLSMTIEGDVRGEDSDESEPDTPRSRAVYLCDTMRALDKRRKKSVKQRAMDKDIRERQRRSEARSEGGRPSTAPSHANRRSSIQGRPQTANDGRDATGGDDGKSAITYYLEELEEGDRKVSTSGSYRAQLPVHGAPYVVPLLQLSKVRDALGTAQRMEEESKPKFAQSATHLEKKKKRNKIMTMEAFLHQRPRTARVLTPRPASSKPYDPHYNAKAAAALGTKSHSGTTQREREGATTTVPERPTTARPPTGERLRAPWSAGPRQRRVQTARPRTAAARRPPTGAASVQFDQSGMPLSPRAGSEVQDSSTLSVQQILAQVSGEIARATRAARTNPKTFRQPRPKTSMA